MCSLLFCFGLLAGALGWSVPTASGQAPAYRLESPAGATVVTVTLPDGVPHYAVSFHGQAVLAPSPLGLVPHGAAAFGPVEVVEVGATGRDTTWAPLWGASSRVRDRHAELRLLVRETAAPHRRYAVVFRAFEDGVGFRYEIPAESGLGGASGAWALAGEQTAFRFAQPEQATAWWIPGDPDSYEALYHTTPLAAVDTAHTPLTLKLSDSLYAAIHEAALTDYPSMRLVPAGPATLGADLVPLKGTAGIAAYLTEPFATPWRVVLLGRRAGALIASDLVLNLNEPCAICDGDTSWIEPGKYVGIWWSIHKGTATWAPGPHVGATTEATKRYIDFAAAHDIPLVLAEGWNEGWEGDWSDMDFVTPQPAFDLEVVVRYGRERGVRFIAHMETGSNVTGMEAQLDTAFALYEQLGIPAIKTGYVGSIDGHVHHDQRMVRHYQDVVERAARHRIMVNAHEPIKPTGKRRTFPNFMTREGVRGQEWEAWSEGNPPSHTVTLPFTRMLAGPLDYTPGIFAIRWAPERVPDSPFYDGPQRRVHTTRGHQLALYVVFLSGLQMVTDIPEHYEDVPEFAFVEAVPVTWDATRVLSGEVGEHLVIARRSGQSWYVGAITDATPRTLEIPLGFLGEGTYGVTIYGDGPETDLATNPEAVQILERRVTAADTLTVHLAAGGGAALQIVPRPSSP